MTEDRLFAKDFIRNALVAEIGKMLVELGNPPMVDRIFPKGWRQADQGGLMNLYDLCVRTFRKREASND